MGTIVQSQARRRPAGISLLWPALAVLTVTAAVVTLSLPLGVALIMLIAPGVTAAGAALAFWRFDVFTLAVLVVRPLVDVLKVPDLPAAVQPTSLLSLSFLAVAPLWLVAQRRRLGAKGLTVLAAASLGYLLAAALSTAGSEFPAHSAVELLTTASWVCMFLVVRRLIATDETTLRPLLTALFLSAALPVLLGAYELLMPGAGAFMEQKDGILRLRSTFDQSNNFARYLMLLLTMALALLGVVARRSRYLVACAVLAGLILFGATYTRSAWVGLLAAVVTLLVFRGRVRALVVSAGSAVVAVVLMPGGLGALAQLTRPAPSTDWTNNSVSWRLDYWSEIAGLVRDGPVTGIGPGVTMLRTAEGKEPHNEYLRALVEGGAVGLLAFLALLAACLYVTIAVARSHDRVTSAVGVGAAGVVVGVVVASAASNVFDSISFTWFFAAVAGAVDALYLTLPGRSIRGTTIART